ncbi:PREDICTED: zona pellucida sperm-binding protein 3 receptor [Chinchilla lanigera]|uniref:Zona pellucida sperm-binding protein 3 receptor n=1 Tax=Chinchilla lanigera TaxID=34839 RepID=A0A8C2VLS8_CHILA|nr:PREDICTED: zona pellucida sperm-binding protein 3 receptor [Chinchilla lanigera]XP_013358336.1 PREDICTED: zona pellucida sperm-binding protein 3 receptor [Chinchilla lanigera]
MCSPGATICALPESTALPKKRKLEARTFPRLWTASDPALFRITLVVALLAPVIGDCGPPPILPFASPAMQSYETNFRTGTALRYNCHHGYWRVNTSHVICDISGSWIYNVFCAKKRCRNPGELANGKVEIITDLLFGSTIEFSCSKGYTLIGSTTSQCESQGKAVHWSDPLPECVIVKCESPPDISNGKHSGRDEDLYTYGSSVTYICDPNYSLLGNASISCIVVNKTIGVWSPRPPTCEKIICRQPHIPKGIFHSGFGLFYTYKDTLVISCNKGYILRGSSIIHCEANGKWYPSVPTCEPNGCVDLPDIPYISWERNILSLRNQEIFEIGTQVKYQCKAGYRSLPDVRRIVTCQDSLKWTVSKGCERVCCPTPNMEKMRIINERRDFTGVCLYAYEDYIFYMCDEGYFPVSVDGRSLCQADGTWNPKIPACESAGCLRPEILNGKLSVEKDRYTEMEKVTIHCDSGYELVGPQSITCSENRTWSPEVPKCEREVPEDCKQVIAGRKLLECLPNPADVKMALEVYKLSLEIQQLEKEKYMQNQEKFPEKQKKQ